MEAIGASQQIQNKEIKTPKSKKDKKDVYTQTPLRKIGFLDEFGEALRPILSTSSKGFARQLPNFAYIPATIYMAADVADKYKKGLDGNGEKPSIKMAAREAAYQGIVSVAAPIGIVKAVHKVTGAIVEKSKNKIPEAIRKTGAKTAESLSKNKFGTKALSKAGMPAKIAGAAISIFALSKLSKPVDFLVSKFFEKVVDPKIGVPTDKKKD